MVPGTVRDAPGRRSLEGHVPLTPPARASAGQDPPVTQAGIGLGAALVLAAGISLLLAPPGLLALAIGVGCLWRWDQRTEDALQARGLSRRVRTGAGGTILAMAALANLALGGQLDGHLEYRGDFQTYFVGAELGLRHGWAHLFDQGLQRPLWTAAFADRAPFIPFLNTPPQAWLVAPLTRLGYPLAYATWVAMMAVAAAATAWLVAPPTWRGRLATGLAALSLWVLAYSLASGQNAIIGALAVALCWRLARAGHPGWAGVALALIIIRPNATLLVPVALLLAGYRRVFLAWLGATLLAGLAIILSLGAPGLRQFAALGAEVRRTHPGAVTLTVAHIVGHGAGGVLVGVALAAAALWVAWRRRGQPLERAIVAGVLASMFVTPYVHVQDLLILIVVAAVLARSSPRWTFGLVLLPLLLAAPPGSIFGGAWPALLLAVEVGWLAWLARDRWSASPAGWLPA